MINYEKSVKMETAQSRRFQKEISLLTEAFTDINVSHQKSDNGYKITITKPDLECIFDLPKDWPFNSPLISITYKTHNWQRKIHNWSAAIDLRTIYAEVLDDIKKNVIVQTDKQIEELKKEFADIKINFDIIFNIVEINYDGLNINIFLSNERRCLYVFEKEYMWPKDMVPSIEQNFTSLVHEIINTRNKIQSKDPNDYLEKINNSLRTKFDNIIYSSNHQTFTIDCPQGLITIGIDPIRQYIPPRIIVFHQGQIMSKKFDFNNWGSDSNLGEILISSI